jgi:glutamine amidotransferase
MIAVIDYGAGNLRSIRRALESAGASVEVTSDPAVVKRADAVVLPGVGAAAHAMERLRDLGMIEPITEVAKSGVPFLGICLGMQLLFEDQEEGDTHGLGLIGGRVRSLDGNLKVPHMGWNRSRVVKSGPLGQAGEEHYYYFVHSYVAEPNESAVIAAVADYGGEFPSIVVKDNVWGTQFHPEKSAADGLDLVHRFVEAAGESGSNAPGNRPYQASNDEVAL